MLGAVLLWASAEHLTGPELGLARRGIHRSLVWGLLAGGLTAIPILLFFALPLVANRAVVHPGYTGISRGRLLSMLAGQVLLSTAVFEEIAFRGVLHAKLVRVFGARRAVLAGSGLFAAWHAVIAWHNLHQAGLSRTMRAVLYLGAMTALFVAGLILGSLRQMTGHVAGSIVAHWLMVVAIVCGVVRLRDRGSTHQGSPGRGDPAAAGPPRQVARASRFSA
jgi:membrane protease YdiL (CAAX protease family)